MLPHKPDPPLARLLLPIRAPSSSRTPFVPPPTRGRTPSSSLVPPGRLSHPGLRSAAVASQASPATAPTPASRSITDTCSTMNGNLIYNYQADQFGLAAVARATGGVAVPGAQPGCSAPTRRRLARPPPGVMTSRPGTQVPGAPMPAPFGSPAVAPRFPPFAVSRHASRRAARTARVFSVADSRRLPRRPARICSVSGRSSWRSTGSSSCAGSGRVSRQSAPFSIRSQAVPRPARVFDHACSRARPLPAPSRASSFLLRRSPTSLPTRSNAVS